MNRIFGYGPGPLTLWALREKLGFILSEMEDTTPPEVCLVLVAPRYGWIGPGGQVESRECAAVAVSRRSVYLMESAWDAMGENSDKVLALPRPTMEGHAALTWYLATWVEAAYAGWGEFVSSRGKEFTALFPGRTLPPAGSSLAVSMEDVCARVAGEYRRLDTMSPLLRKVLLYFFDSSRSVPKSTVLPAREDNVFRVINIDYNRALAGAVVPLV